MKLHFAAGFVLLCSLLAGGCSGTAQTITFTSLSVRSSTRSFLYQCSDSHLTVNGAAADEEVFRTLLSHLASSISGQDISYTPDEDPLLEVTLNTSEGIHEITYYKDSSDSALVYVRIASSSEEEVTTTEAWRIGTILLACEGSRIQDPQNPDHHKDSPDMQPAADPSPESSSQP